MSPQNYPQTPDRHHEYSNKGLVIIGGGVGGMLTAIDMLKRGINNFTILEKSSNVGGTWLQNQYPGCQCDVLSLLYSVSFEQNSQWSREYPGQEEMLRYLIGIASKYNLYAYIRFNSQVEAMRWDDATQQWHTDVKVAGLDSEYQNRYTIKSDFLVSAVGQLNQPSYPDIKGLETFQGKTMHSARWDWSYDLRGKRIACIGNGATAVQIVPEVAAQCEHLTVHQRTPNWVVSRFDAAVPEWRKTLYKTLPFLQHRHRAQTMDFREWTHGFVARDQEVTDAFGAMFFGKLQENFPDDPEMRAALTPNYHIGCKRIILSDDYIPTLARENVRLETRTISQITPTGVSVSMGDGQADSHEEVDMIILATGFRTVEFMHPIKVTGRNGRALKDIWSGGASAYKGVTVEDLPNFGILYGPNTNLGHSSIILMEEAQANYIGTLIEAVLGSRKTKKSGSSAIQKVQDGEKPVPLSLVPRKNVVDSYNDWLSEQLGRTAFADPKCKSWYKDPKSGRITNNWSGPVIEYQKLLERVTWDDYENGELVTKNRNGEIEVVIPRVVEETTLSNPMYYAVGALSVAAAGTLATLALRNAKNLASLLRA